ncbi:hypothetical protein BGW37DRAFT_522889 [Umbelopsis sp. PMI_123]|nr:hypothetical protein BGW37DRAFT_522889 [Umbelopsis sp. PMI_123]
MAKLKPKFETEEAWSFFLEVWTTTAMSKTEDSFRSNWPALCCVLEISYVVRYITDTWMPYKERFASAWMSRYMHLGISLAVTNQEREIKATRAIQLLRVPHVLGRPHVLGKVFTRISTFALLKVFDQWRRVAKRRKGHLSHHARPSSRPRWGCYALMSSNNMSVQRRSLKSMTFHRQWWLTNGTIVEDIASEHNIDGHFGALETTLGQLSHRYVEMAPHQQMAVRRNLQEMLYFPSNLLQSPIRQERTRRRPSRATNRQSGHNSRTCPNVATALHK